jgi:hypothetical protein
VGPVLVTVEAPSTAKGLTAPSVCASASLLDDPSETEGRRYRKRKWFAAPRNPPIPSP